MFTKIHLKPSIQLFRVCLTNNTYSHHNCCFTQLLPLCNNVRYISTFNSSLCSRISFQNDFRKDGKKNRNSDWLPYDNSHRYYCDAAKPPEKLSLGKRLKAMYKDYWYVLVPVHLFTSSIWFGGFYYALKSGVDVASLLENVGAGEKLVEKLRSGHSTTGYLALSYALYKIFTPLRYTVTIGGTTLSIKYLKEWGYIKPLPPKDKLKEIYQEKKDILIEKKDNLKELYKEQKEALKTDSCNSLLDRILIKLKIKRNK